jgi:hypothetical protein
VISALVLIDSGPVSLFSSVFPFLAVNERHLKRLLSEYVRYHHEDRTHLGLEKGTPEGRIRSEASGRVLSQERLGGLHHRYNRAA